MEGLIQGLSSWVRCLVSCLFSRWLRLGVQRWRPQLYHVAHEDVWYWYSFSQYRFVSFARWWMIVRGFLDGLVKVGRETGMPRLYVSHDDSVLARTWELYSREWKCVAASDKRSHSRCEIGSMESIWCISAMRVVWNIPSIHLSSSA